MVCYWGKAKQEYLECWEFRGISPRLRKCWLFIDGVMFIDGILLWENDALLEIGIVTDRRFCRIACSSPFSLHN